MRILALYIKPIFLSIKLGNFTKVKRQNVSADTIGMVACISGCFLLMYFLFLILSEIKVISLAGVKVRMKLMSKWKFMSEVII